MLGANAANAAGAGETTFADLRHHAWAADSIEYLAGRGTVAGYGPNSFGPEGVVTRGQATTFLMRELQGRMPEPAAAAENTPYTDVPASHPFRAEIAAAQKLGLVGGFPDGTFRPDAPVTRAETAALLTRAYALKAGGQAVRLPADAEAHWAAPAIGIMTAHGLVGGYPDGTYRPNKPVTRAEYAVFLTRVIRTQRAAAIEAQDWERLISYMTVSEQAGQMLMLDIRQWNGKPTTAVHDGVKQQLDSLHLGGYIVFDKNIVDAEQLTRLTHELQAEAGDIPLFLGIDQEGGVVKRLPGGTNLPGQMALGATRDPALAEAAGQLTGKELRALGLQLNFAPVLDINSNPDNPIIGIRSFGSDPEWVTRLGLASMKGMQASRVIPAVKHFPGHGDTQVDSHLGLPVLAHDRTRLDAVELRPFRAAIEQGAEMIMTAHVAFPAIDNEQTLSRKDGSRVPVPATLSKKVLTGLLREELGYDGVVISDAFTMEAIAEHYGEQQAVVRAVAAGVDIVLMPQQPEAAHQALVDAVQRGAIDKQAMRESVLRILKLKHRYGLFEPEASLAAKQAKVKEVVGAAPHRALEQQIAERAVTLLAGRDGKLPDRIREGDHVVIAAADETIAKQLEQQLAVHAPSRKLTTEVVLLGSTNATAALSKADYTVLASYQFRNVASTQVWSGLQAAIDALNEQGRQYALLSLGNPYELSHLRRVESALAVYGKQAPNTAAGLKVLLGVLGPQGTKPS